MNQDNMHTLVQTGHPERITLTITLAIVLSKENLFSRLYPYEDC